MFAISASILLSDSAALLKSILYQSHVSVRSVGRKKSSGQEHAAIKNLKRSPVRRSCVAPRLRRRRTTCSSKHTMPNRLVCRRRCPSGSGSGRVGDGGGGVRVGCVAGAIYIRGDAHLPKLFLLSIGYSPCVATGEIKTPNGESLCTPYQF
jgi:hypothetical protein